MFTTEQNTFILICNFEIIFNISTLLYYFYVKLRKDNIFKIINLIFRYALQPTWAFSVELSLYISKNHEETDKNSKNSICTNNMYYNNMYVCIIICTINKLKKLKKLNNSIKNKIYRCMFVQK